MSFNPSVFVQVWLVAVGILALASFLGYGLARLILPHAVRHLAWLFSPFFGIALAVPLLEINAYFGRGAQLALLPLCILAAVLIVWSHFVPSSTRQTFRQFWPFVIGVFILLMLASLPITTATRLLTIGGNGDAISYAARIDYFVDHGIAPPPITSFRPNDALIAAALGARLRQGESLFLAAVCSILPLKAYQLFSVAINLWYALTVLSVVIVGALLFDLPSRYALILLGLVGFNATLIWANYDDFLSQQMVMPLSLLYILFLSTGLMHSTSPWREKAYCFACAALFLAAIYSVYPEILPILVLFSLTVLTFSPMSLMQRFRYFGWGLLISVVSIASNPIGFYRMLEHLPIQSGSAEMASSAARMVAGNIRYFPSLYEIVSLTPHNQFAPYGVSFGLSIAIWFCFLLVLAVITVGIVKSRQQRTLLTALMLPIFLLLIANYAWSFPYGYMKILTEGTIFIELTFVVSLYTFFQGRANPPLPVLPGSLVRLAVALSLAAHFVSTLIVIRRETLTRQPLTPAIEELSHIDRQLTSHNTVLIHGVPRNATQMWALYFLHTPMITIPDINVDYYPRIDSHAVADYLLVQKGSSLDDTFLQIWQGTPTYETPNFALYPKRPEYQLVFRLPTLFEREQAWSGHHSQSEHQLAFRSQALAMGGPSPANQVLRIDVNAEELRVRSASFGRSYHLINDMTGHRVATPFEVVFLTGLGRRIDVPICTPNDHYQLDRAQAAETIQAIRAILIRHMADTCLRSARSSIAINRHRVINVTVGTNTASPLGFVDAPAPGATVSGIVEIDGWAVDRETSIAGLTLTLLVDANPVRSTLVRRFPRLDVCITFPEAKYPWSCQSGFALSWNTEDLSGSHTIAVRVTNAGGLSAVVGTRRVTVKDSG